MRRGAYPTSQRTRWNLGRFFDSIFYFRLLPVNLQKREWDREKHPDEERANNYSKSSGGRRSNEKMGRQDRNSDRFNNSRGGRNDRGDRQNRDSGYSQFRDNRRDRNSHRGGLEPGFEGPAPPRRNDRDRGSRDHRDFKNSQEFGDRDIRIRQSINPLEGPTRPGGRYEKRKNRRAHNEEQREHDVSTIFLNTSIYQFLAARMGTYKRGPALDE